MNIQKQELEGSSNNYFLWDAETLLRRYTAERYSGTLSGLSGLCRDAFRIEGNIGNNSFSYIPGRSLSVAPVCEYRKNSVIESGEEIAFADVWDNELRLSSGLKNAFVGMTGGSGTPFYLCDNHNLVLEGWSMVKSYIPPLILVHLDQHRDDAVFEGSFDNFLTESRICDYIDFAKRAEWIDVEHLSFTESIDFEEDIQLPDNRRFILNIDLDLFAPEVTHISLKDKINLIKKVIPRTELITIATSPGFIEQSRAIPLAELLISYL